MQRFSKHFSAFALCLTAALGSSIANAQDDVVKVGGVKAERPLYPLYEVRILGVGPNQSLVTDANGYVSSGQAQQAQSGGGGITTVSTLAAGISACGSTATVLDVASAVAVPANLTVPDNCTLRFDTAGQLQPATGVTVTINGDIQASRLQHIFAGAGLVALGRNHSRAYAAWFGAAGDYAGGAGTNDSAALQAALNALWAGDLILENRSYLACNLQVNRSNLGINGQSTANTAIFCNSASADVVDVVGTNVPSASSAVFNNRLGNFEIFRTVAPANGSKGVRIENAWAVNLLRVNSNDSAIDFYIHYSPGLGEGEIRDCQGGWGQGSALAGYSGSVSLYGWYIDSNDGNGASPFFVNDGAGINGGPTSYAWYVTGTAVNDQNFFNPASSGTSYGFYLTVPAGTPPQFFSDGDIWVYMGTWDGFTKAGIFVSGLQAAGLGGLNFEGGYALTNSSDSTALDAVISGSSGVTLQGMQFGFPNAASAVGLQISGGTSNKVIGSTFRGIQIPLMLLNTFNNVVNGNTFVSKGSSGTLIFVQGSARNAITGNTLTGQTGTGMYFDSGSNHNTTVGNNLDTGLTTAYTDNGGGNAPYTGSCASSTTVTVVGGVITGCQ